MLRTIFLLFLISLAAAVSPAQTQDKEYKISARDKAEVQRLAKRFVARMQQTRDVGPLMPTFFLKDFDVLFEGQPICVDHFEGPKLTKSQWRREFIAVSNEIYLTELSYLLSDHYKLSGILSDKLAKVLEDSSLGSEWEGKVTKSDVLTKLSAWEKGFRAAKAELRRKNIEGSLPYKKAWEKRNDGPYDYVVQKDILWKPGEPDPDVMPGLKKRSPNGEIGYFVTTPAGPLLIFVKERGRFKIILVGMFPVD